MERRQFLLGCATAMVGILPATATIAEEASYAIGEFVVVVRAAGFRVEHRTSPGRVLWESPSDRGFLVAQQATMDTKSFGEPQGSFRITDTVAVACDRQTIDDVAVENNVLAISGTLSGERSTIGYWMLLTPIDARQLQMAVRLAGPGAAQFNRIILRSASTADEAFFGFGQQLTYLNQKGNLLPILVQEHGVGRGRPVVTQVVDVATRGGGRNPFVTEAPAPHYLSSRLRSFCLEQTEYSEFDLRHADRVEVKVFTGELTARIFNGATPLDAIEAYTAYAGRMRALPDWIHEGAVIAVQGGTEIARNKLAALVDARVPVSAFWIQDWTGVRTTNAGTQLWWDWRLDETRYPDWDDLVASLAQHDARVLIYINPFLSTEPGHDSRYSEALQGGYLVRQADGSPYLIRNTNFSAAMIDLSNPECRAWIRRVIVEEMIGHAGASGWMADFGEALPFDARLHDAAEPATWHNHYTEQWAQVNREAIDEAGRGDDIVFFNRSGFTHSPAHSTLFWLGDQLQSWDEYDGIKTAVVGMLSGGTSGFSMVHSDIGGYVSLSIRIAGHKVPVFARSKELLMRWMELAAFTSVFRTHEGIDPDVAAQYDTDEATFAHLARCVTIYKALAPYRRELVAEAAAKGHPLTRHMFLHYPNDPTTHNLRYQFLIGPDILVAPVLEARANSVSVYAPAGEDRWTHIWTGNDLGEPGRWHTVEAPLGRPAVFVRAGATVGDELRRTLRDWGIN